MKQMNDLVKTLERFNRKERYWLIRNALGESSKKLDDTFIKNLSAVLGITIPGDAWWAMDYHLDWLIGALHLLGGGAVNDPIANDDLIMGTQQDMDLVIAFERTLILIEAKADTSWSNEQLNEKVARLTKIIEAECNLIGDLQIYFVLMSPKVSEEIEPKSGNWPFWMTNGKNEPLFLKLEMPSDLLRVVRCDTNGKSNNNGGSWKILSKNHKNS